MTIRFPEFKNPHCFWIRVCGEVPSVGQALGRRMKKEDDKFGTFETPRGTARARLMLGGGSGKHVHFDMFSPEFASKRLKRSPKSKADQIQEALTGLFGREIKANLQGGFKAKFDELPDSGIIRSLLFKTKIGNVGIKLNGAMFAIEGAPIQSISWRESSDRNINITLEAELISTTLSEDYLVNASATLELAFNIFVLGKAQDGSK